MSKKLQEAKKQAYLSDMLMSDLRLQSIENAHGAGFEKGALYGFESGVKHIKQEYEEKLKNSIEIPSECICSCKNQKIIELVYPLPPVCDYCRKMIRRSFL